MVEKHKKTKNKKKKQEEKQGTNFCLKKLVPTLGG